MAPGNSFVAFGIALLGLCGASGAPVDELIRRRDASASGVIDLSDRDFMKFADSSTKKYSLVLFFNAKSKASPQVGMPQHFGNFKLVSQHVKTAAKASDETSPANRVFFVAVEFDESPKTFMRLNVQSVPWVLHLGPKARAAGSNDRFDLPAADKMDNKVGSSGAIDVATVSEFVAARTGHDFGTPHVPSTLERPEVQIAIVVTLLLSGYSVVKLWAWISHPAFLASGCLVVFLFAVSGGMYNIIRGVPFTAIDRDGKAIWYRAGQGQLGAEGLVAGLMYVAFAACCFALINAPQWFGHLQKGDAPTYRMICYGLLLAAVFLCQRIVHFYAWKTGYRIRFYLLDWLQGVRS